MNVIKCIPPNKINWKPKKDKMSLGDIIRHLALAERYLYVGIAKYNNNLYPGFQESETKSYKDIVDFLIKCHNDSIVLLRSIDNSELLKKVTVPGGAEITMWKWLRAMIEHEVHHRGIIYADLSLLNIETPPLFGLEEIEARKKK